MSIDAPHPHIRSFSSRRGHITAGQRNAYQTLLAQYALADGGGIIDPIGSFGRAAPLVLEIGFGMGESIAGIAAVRPEHDFIGVEVYPAGVGSLLMQLDRLGLSNVRIIQQDAVAVVRDRLAPAMLAGIHVFFPDPWPKLRHHKRRLIQGPFVALLASRLAAGGYLHCATDWENYAQQMLAVLSAEPLLANTARGFAPRPDYRPLTRFEQRGLRLGHPVWDLVFTRCARASGRVVTTGAPPAA